MNGNHHVRPWHGIHRDELIWHPLIQSCLCDGCGLCVTSCPEKALAFDFRLNLPFVDPLRCLVGCSICATLCPHEAILLPDRCAAQEIVEKYHLDSEARMELRRHRKRFAGLLPQSDCSDNLVGNQN